MRRLIATQSDSQPLPFSDDVALRAARWVNRLHGDRSRERWKVEFEAWLAADPSHHKALRAMQIAACFLKAARPDATSQDLRDLEDLFVPRLKGAHHLEE